MLDSEQDILVTFERHFGISKAMIDREGVVSQELKKALISETIKFLNTLNELEESYY